MVLPPSFRPAAPQPAQVLLPPSLLAPLPHHSLVAAVPNRPYRESLCFLDLSLAGQLRQVEVSCYYHGP